MTSLSTTAPSVRLWSIDQVRGAIMILMALDHVRWFFTNIGSYQPETLGQTNLLLFLTRWVTHYCAPGFFLIAGLGIFLYGAKRSRPDLVRYLLTRGFFLIALELTIVGFAWVFTPGYSFGGVIWALGWSFVLMAGLVYLPRKVLVALTALVLLFHNSLLDGVDVTSGGWGQFLWRVLYRPGLTDIPGIVDGYFILFPIIPWLAMMVLGYWLGQFYLKPTEERRRLFVRLGWGFLIFFAALRLTNLSGEPETLWISSATSGLFTVQQTLADTVINFLNTEKYPPSLQFSLMTLGPILLWLAYSRLDLKETRANFASRVMVLFGRVPLFFYILHLYLIHLLALVVASVAGQPVGWISWLADTHVSRPEGYGFDLGVVHLMWIVTVAILYVACRWYEAYKRTHTYPWLKYL